MPVRWVEMLRRSRVAEATSGVLSLPLTASGPDLNGPLDQIGSEMTELRSFLPRYVGARSTGTGFRSTSWLTSPLSGICWSIT